ncbi:MAG: P-II family nitrogen regulator [Candidatus Melainabacteria bacterium]|nr:P-II family nitrogen regulator [Candidatus Melainabacteria bacterium]
MKLVTAIIQPYMFDKLARVFRKTHHACFTVFPVKSFGVPEGGMAVDLMTEKVRVDVVVQDEEAIEVAELIANTVGTHQEGDGMVFVSEISYAININTGQRGAEALQPSAD